MELYDLLTHSFLDLHAAFVVHLVPTKQMCGVRPACLRCRSSADIHLVLDVHQVLESLDVAALSRRRRAVWVMRLHLPTQQRRLEHVASQVTQRETMSAAAGRRPRALTSLALHCICCTRMRTFCRCSASRRRTSICDSERSGRRLCEHNSVVRAFYHACRTAYLDAEVGGLRPAVCCAGCGFMLCMAGATLHLLLRTGLICVR